jgi:hypothetical protein
MKDFLQDIYSEQIISLLTSFSAMLIILEPTFEWTLSVNAQADSSKNESKLTDSRDGLTSGSKTHP